MRKINSFWVPSILAISQISTKCRIESKQRNFKLAKVKMFKRFNEHLPNMVAQLTHKYISQREILRVFAARGGGSTTAITIHSYDNSTYCKNRLKKEVLSRTAKSCSILFILLCCSPPFVSGGVSVPTGNDNSNTTTIQGRALHS